jgi:phosphoribosylglycinamide formyltransferase-1
VPEKIVAHIDGGSRGNPGPAAAGFTLTDTAGTQLQARGIVLGRTTNNVAEYTGLVKALEAASQIGAEQLVVFSDSELLVRQINGEYKVKSKLLKPFYEQAVSLLESFEGWQVRHIRRENNVEADKLVNLALDAGHDVETKCQPTARKKKPIRLGVLISGGGTTLINIIEYIWQGKLNAEVAVVISSLSKANGLAKAKNAGLDAKIVRKKDCADIDQFSKHIEAELVAADVDLVVQGGWLCLWKIPARYENRVMNIHPALLPSFGGRGMWGHHVHEAVLKAGCKISGCTVHFCTNEYDKGPIIVQRACEARSDDTPDTLAVRVFEQECIAYPQAIGLFAEGRVSVRDGIAVIG